jgi:hypothetical protein
VLAVVGVRGRHFSHDGQRIPSLRDGALARSD